MTPVPAGHGPAFSRRRGSAREENGNTEQHDPAPSAGMQEKLFNRLMDVIEYDVAPLTRKRVAIGCKVFGAAVLRKDDLSLVLAETNMEAFSPLWHGEVYAIKQFWELQGHPDPKDCIFIATHQPCCMCASAIAWSGFPELFYLFGYENTSKDFHIPL